MALTTNNFDCHFAPKNKRNRNLWSLEERKRKPNALSLVTVVQPVREQALLNLRQIQTRLSGHLSASFLLRYLQCSHNITSESHVDEMGGSCRMHSGWEEALNRDRVWCGESAVNCAGFEVLTWLWSVLSPRMWHGVAWHAYRRFGRTWPYDGSTLNTLHVHSGMRSFILTQQAAYVQSKIVARSHNDSRHGKATMRYSVYCPAT
jgi:hypothetical protein